MFKKLAYVISLTPFSEALTTLILSDIHLNLLYQSSGSTRDNCFSQEFGKEGALLKYGCDPSREFFEELLAHVSKQVKEIDFILLPGDLVAHDVPLENGEINPFKYRVLKETHAVVIDLIQQNFPDTLILPTMGNNDAKYHY